MNFNDVRFVAKPGGKVGSRLLAATDKSASSTTNNTKTTGKITFASIDADAVQQKELQLLKKVLFVLFEREREREETVFFIMSNTRSNEKNERLQRNVRQTTTMTTITTAMDDNQRKNVRCLHRFCHRRSDRRPSLICWMIMMTTTMIMMMMIMIKMMLFHHFLQQQIKNNHQQQQPPQQQQQRPLHYHR
jgi:hypothetical protein